MKYREVMRFHKSLFYLALFIGLYAHGSEPQNWQMTLQDPASPMMSDLVNFHRFLVFIIFGISLFVLALLGYACFKFSKKRNPVASKVSHNTLLEIIWTTIPILILIVIAIPSIKSTRKMEKIENPDMTIKVVGHQWYWEYQYPDHGNIAFDSYIIKDEDLKPGQLRLLEVDNRVIVPIETNIKVLLTSQDVIHSWSVPSLGVKKDTVPGRVNQTWFRVIKPGVYYGQCSEICGFGHGFMPIAVEAVTKEEFNKWVQTKQLKGRV